MEQVQRNLHLFGRYGITMFAISGLDIALWDIAAKVKGVPLHRLIGDIKRTRIPAYASLLRIGKPELIAGECRTARQLGYTAIKLHETTTPAVFAARDAIGAGIPLMVDMNCPMDGATAMMAIGEARERVGAPGATSICKPPASARASTSAASSGMSRARAARARWAPRARRARRRAGGGVARPATCALGAAAATAGGSVAIRMA